MLCANLPYPGTPLSFTSYLNLPLQLLSCSADTCRCSSPLHDSTEHHDGLGTFVRSHPWMDAYIFPDLFCEPVDLLIFRKCIRVSPFHDWFDCRRLIQSMCLIVQVVGYFSSWHANQVHWNWLRKSRSCHLRICPGTFVTLLSLIWCCS